MELFFCQSCGKPLQAPEQYGTNEDGSENQTYCCFCYKEGAFTSDCTMEEMIENCVQYLKESNKSSHTTFSKKTITVEMKKYFPTLKRWIK